MAILYLLFAIVANIAVAFAIFLGVAIMTKDIQAAWQWMLIYLISGALVASLRHGE